jgi:chromosome segregation ATPase
MEAELKEKELEIGQTKDINAKLVQEILSLKEIVQKQERNLNNQITINSYLSQELLENKDIIRIQGRRYTELKTEVEISKGEWSEIVRINENLKQQLNSKISQFNHDLQVKQSEIDKLSSLIKSRQGKFKAPINYNPTDLWA